MKQQVKVTVTLTQRETAAVLYGLANLYADNYPFAGAIENAMALIANSARNAGMDWANPGSNR